MSTFRLFVPLLALLLLGPGCGGKSSGGNGNIIDSSGTLTINAPSDVIKCGACQPFTATYTKRGVSQTVNPTWSTDNAVIATIDASGQLTPLTHGDITVTARYEDATATKPIHVVNDYQAAWYGNYLITRCQVTGRFDPDWCSEEGFAAGQTLPLAMDLQQDRANVTGTLYLGSVEGPFTGTVAAGGDLTGESKFTFSGDDGTLDVLVSPFSALRQGDRITEGSFTHVFTAAGVVGNCTFDARIMGLDKVPAGRSSLRQVPSRARTLKDIWRLMRGR